MKARKTTMKHVKKDALEQIRAQHDGWLKKYGFYIHSVFPAAGQEHLGFDHHTHGIAESFRHPDFQIKLGVAQGIAAALFHDFVNRIKEGERFTVGASAALPDGTFLNGFLHGFPVKLVAAVENGRELIRIVLPDPQGRFPGQPGCHPDYAHQEDGVGPMVQ